MFGPHSTLRRKYDRLTRQQKIIIGSTVGGGFLLFILIASIFHERIIEYFKPLAEKYTRRPGGFLVPSFMLMLACIPPILGHELISFLTGFVYGNVGFLIVIISTALGETILFLSFRHFLTSRLVSFRKKYKDYDIFVRIIEEGGTYMIVAIRCSAVPSHFSTPLFASIEEIEYKTWLICFFISSFSLYPPVYLGWLLKRGESSRITPWLLTTAVLVTASVCVYIWIQYRRHKSARPVHDVPVDEEAGLSEADHQNLLDDFEMPEEPVEGSPRESFSKTRNA
ncbi:Golgi apparatus membrane protein tvp38 [Taphrina deformans PYCC 5710]|uniref:Golgi apparatus membrane protein TVP38 n=1 Tax=Taphrina deformans (strain PYCC 5710 / ATCC 11124 / CBS 356.35 / IMI 108563 / JCM 9778 / NBRC 8474) TaxID=1097556 RepID=R4X7M3_TAPDE|nr:Golgi apparatus membrane protein tvp38 [Taphrina deformans PYCC 5710]|eukprot:CCG81143.1 Golgi apparatus membrane protein tvp38 [Taphrina deformans PYCC 5710]